MKKIFLLFVSAMLLSACSAEEKKPKQKETVEAPKLVEVEIIVPDKVELNQEIEIKAHVTQDGENVEDANEVLFDISKAGATERENIKAAHAGDGVYAITKTFTENGNYQVVAHVTAREMHTMPKKDIVAGDPNAAPETEADKPASEHSDHGAGNHSTNGKFEISLGEKSFTAGKASAVSASLQFNGKPLEKAEVTFEIWKKGDAKHQYNKAADAGAGVYELNYTFSSSGDYFVTVHVVTDEIHDHVEESVKVN